MKRTITALALLCSIASFAQYPKWYMQFQLGFGDDLSTQQPGLENWVSTRIDNNGEYQESAEYYSYGNGPKLTFTAGAEVARGIGLEAQLGVSYGLPGSVGKSSFAGPSTVETGGTSVYLAPMVRVESEFRSFEEVFVYTRFGPVLSMNYTFLSRSYDSQVQTTKFETDWAFDVGGQGSLGLLLPIKRDVFFSIEAQMVYLVSKPRHGVYTEFEINGEDQLPNMTVADKERSYQSSVTYTSNSPDEPRPTLEVKSAFTHFALNLGLKFML